MNQRPWHHRPKRILAILLAGLVLVVAWQNREIVETRFLFASVRMPRAALILLSLVIGFVLGVVDTKFRRGMAKAPRLGSTDDTGSRGGPEGRAEVDPKAPQPSDSAESDPTP